MAMDQILFEVYSLIRRVDNKVSLSLNAIKSYNRHF